ncbi:hypothetical protein RHMOL_Rhmol13G0218400 [Rhododendron molle]|uniref:Uncharacterized protein n=1 Tax=Rhododendron molle TaxID=49168 RepID=A0ACC0LAC6_RHOML|nr:hypothetical protein RHMOL_Rhmol13G0218400 [Rhododendron molle]
MITYFLAALSPLLCGLSCCISWSPLNLQEERKKCFGVLITVVVILWEEPSLSWCFLLPSTTSGGN